jgi:NIMA-interacting peptidyl-prolyl cis-trans isomerase 4
VTSFSFRRRSLRPFTQTKTKPIEMGGNKKSSSSSQPSALKPAQAVSVRHILCAKQSKALEALAKLDAGEPFASVAQAYSEDKARQGGALGWKTKQELVPAFAEAAFALNVGERTKAPVTSEFGYHLILVEGRK